MAQSSAEKAYRRWVGIGPGRPSWPERLRPTGTDEDGCSVREKVPSVSAMIFHAPSALEKLLGEEPQKAAE